VDGPAHLYMTCSTSCWQRYGELLAAQYSDPERMVFHQLVVDTYAVQHPGGDDPRAVRSVGIHLMTLCLFLERGVDPALGTKLHRRMVDRPVFHRLTPPTYRGRSTVLDVPIDTGASTARTAAFEWARDVWAAWRANHPTVRRWIGESSLDTPS